MRILPLATALLVPSLLSAQALPRELARERAEAVRWVSRDPLSPAKALALLELSSTGISLGPDGSEVLVEGAPLATITESGGALTLKGWGADLALPRERVTAVRGIRILPRGAAGHTTLLIYRDATPGKRPLYYPYRRSAAEVVTLIAAEPVTRRILGPDGTVVSGADVGTVISHIGGTATALRVMRIPEGQDESRLLINLRDGTTGSGSYPAGRYVELIPRGDKYLLDMNRAFNPYCAYSSVFPCPLPWAGNQIAARVEAGEKYPPAGAH